MPFPDITRFSSNLYTLNSVNSPSPPHHLPPPPPPHESDLITFESEESPPRQILARIYGYIPYQIPEDKTEISYSPSPLAIIPKATFRQLSYEKKLSSFSQ